MVKVHFTHDEKGSHTLPTARELPGLRRAVTSDRRYRQPEWIEEISSKLGICLAPRPRGLVPTNK
jgi:hypothetical protein